MLSHWILIIILVSQISTAFYFMDRIEVQRPAVTKWHYQMDSSQILLIFLGSNNIVFKLSQKIYTI